MFLVGNWLLLKNKFTVQFWKNKKKRERKKDKEKNMNKKAKLLKTKSTEKCVKFGTTVCNSNMQKFSMT